MTIIPMLEDELETVVDDDELETVVDDDELETVVDDDDLSSCGLFRKRGPFPLVLSADILRSKKKR